MCGSRVEAHLWDAREACRAAMRFTAGLTRDEFLGSELHRSAVERQLEIMGEALNRVRRDDPQTALRIEGIDQAIGMRNILTHEYGAVDHEIVWAVVARHLPPLETRLTSLLRASR